jgi:hypothetical protein
MGVNHEHRSRPGHGAVEEEDGPGLFGCQLL